MPATLNVDPITGSQYAIENNHGIVHQQNVAAMKHLFTEELTQEDKRQLSDLNSLYLRQYDKTGSLEPLSESSIQSYHEILANFIQRFGFQKDLSLSQKEYVLSHIDIWRGIYESALEDEWKSDLVEQSLKQIDGYYQKPQKTISSRKYWENWFQEHPDAKPKHIVYYEGTPDNALLQ